MPPSGIFLHPASLITMGIVVGIYAGLMGLGGGSIMIPLMVFLLGFTQAKAHGTSLAVMIVPVVLPAVLRYYKSGNVDVKVAAFLALGVVAGSWVGAKVANSVQDNTLKLIFGFVLIYVAGYTIFASLFGKEQITKSMLFSLSLLGASIVIYLVARSFLPATPVAGRL